MTDTYKKKLIEVAIPLNAINVASGREKSIHNGHPASLHPYWARRPLATCRAVLFAQLVDDPSSHPDKFPTAETVNIERNRLFKIIEDLVKWENTSNEEVLERARVEIRASCGDTIPSIYDPFSGGGSIPLESLRLGLPAYGSDLNPVAVMIGKAMIEIPSMFKNIEPVHPDGKECNHYRNVDGLAEDVKYYGTWLRDEAWKRIGHLYPQVELPKKHGGGLATTIAWLWARTVPSPDSAFCGVDVPLVSSYILSNRSGKEIWIEPVVNKSTKTIKYIIRNNGSNDERDIAKLGTSLGKRKGFRCIMSDVAITYEYIRRMGREGKMNQTLIAVVVDRNGETFYLPPSKEQADVAYSAPKSWKPDLTFEPNALGFRIGNYGMMNFGDIFTDRQLVAMNTYRNLIDDVRHQIEKDAIKSGINRDSTPLCKGGKGNKAYADAVSVYLVFALDKCADYWSSLCSWSSTNDAVRNTFARHALLMVWDYAEVNPFSNSLGNWMGNVVRVSKAISNLPVVNPGIQDQCTAQSILYPPNAVISTDPPYYDNIGYADLSDFFFCWMKMSLGRVYPEIFNVPNTPKDEELVPTPCRHGGKDAAEMFFTKGMQIVFTNFQNQSSGDFPSTIYYAFKRNEIDADGISSTGWISFLNAVIKSGLAIVAAWPMRTEMGNRLRALNSNALANSVVLVCRKRDENAKIITRNDLLRMLKCELSAAYNTFHSTNIAPVDMQQAIIGIGIGVYSRHKMVIDDDNRPMEVKTMLQIINAEFNAFINDKHDKFDVNTKNASDDAVFI